MLVEVLENSVERQIRICDWLVFAAFIMMLLVRFFTISLVFDIAEVTSVEVEKVITVFEANPIAEMVFKLKNFQYIITMVLMPGVVMALYFTFRTLVKKNKMDIIGLQYYTNIIFFMMLINLINDAAYYLTRL